MGMPGAVQLILDRVAWIASDLDECEQTCVGYWQDVRQSDAGATPVLQGRVLHFSGSPSLDPDCVSSQAAATEPQDHDSTAQQDDIAQIQAQLQQLTAVRKLMKQYLSVCATVPMLVSHAWGSVLCGES